MTLETINTIINYISEYSTPNTSNKSLQVVSNLNVIKYSDEKVKEIFNDKLKNNNLKLYSCEDNTEFKFHYERQNKNGFHGSIKCPNYMIFNDREGRNILYIFSRVIFDISGIDNFSFDSIISGRKKQKYIVNFYFDSKQISEIHLFKDRSFKKTIIKTIIENKSIRCKTLTLKFPNYDVWIKPNITVINIKQKQNKTKLRNLKKNNRLLEKLEIKKEMLNTNIKKIQKDRIKLKKEIIALKRNIKKLKNN